MTEETKDLTYYEDDNCIIKTNGKVYANGIQYFNPTLKVEVEKYGKTRTELKRVEAITWNHNTGEAGASNRYLLLGLAKHWRLVDNRVKHLINGD